MLLVRELSEEEVASGEDDAWVSINETAHNTVSTARVTSEEEELLHALHILLS